MRQYIPAIRWVQQLLDLAVVQAILYATVRWKLHGEFPPPYPSIAVIGALLMILIYQWQRVYHHFRAASALSEAGWVLRAWVTVLLALGVLLFVSGTTSRVPRSVLVGWAGLAGLAQLAVHLLVARLNAMLRARGVNRRRALTGRTIMDFARGSGWPRGAWAAAALLAALLLALAGCSKWWGPSGPVGVSAPETAAFVSNEPSITIQVTIVNQSPEEISSEKNFFVSYHLLDPGGKMLKYDNARSRLPAIAPGKSVTVPMLVQRPDEPGTYRLSVDVVHENVAWMVQKGTVAARVNLTVREP